MTLVSPCVGLCKIDPATSYCVGCARTGDEIATWSKVSDSVRANTWSALPTRFAQMGVRCRRLPWDADKTRRFVADSLRQSAGTWVTGVVGAVAEFSAMPGEATQVEVDGDTVTATNTGAKLRFLIDEQVRALTFEADDANVDRGRIVLAVKRDRGGLPRALGVTNLGPDTGAVDPRDMSLDLFDLGLNRSEAQFCVRMAGGPAHETLSDALGTCVPENLPKIGPSLLQESPVRVVETALGRIEVDTPIPPPGGASPKGPHTHLLPDHLARNRAMPDGLDLPSSYLPGAIFYPSA